MIRSSSMESVVILRLFSSIDHRILLQTLPAQNVDLG